MSARRRAAAVVAIAMACVGACSSGSSHSTKAVSTTIVTRPESDAELAAEAYVWGYPLVVTERTLQTIALRAPRNTLTFQPARSDINSRAVVAPNTDTLYAVAPLDLRGEPYVLRVPAIHDRYYVFQFISAYTDSFAYVGTRATGGRAGGWAITAPGWRGTLPAGITRIESPTPQLLLLGRFLVSNDADVARVHALATHITLQPLSAIDGLAPAPAPPAIGTPKGTPQSVAAAGLGFYDELGDALAINPPVDPTEQATLTRFASLGIGPGRHPSTEMRDPRIRAALLDGIRQGEHEIDAGNDASQRVADGWIVGRDVGTYGHNALQRAVVAKNGWGANIPAEAVYAHALADRSGAPLSGAHAYVLHFAPGKLPPVQAFWSVTLYGPDHFFTANAINRYAIGDRTEGLRYGSDGSLDIYVQHGRPVGHEANWLPAPAGPFYLSLRLYLPTAPILENRWQYPALERRG